MADDKRKKLPGKKLRAVTTASRGYALLCICISVLETHENLRIYPSTSYMRRNCSLYSERYKNSRSFMFYRYPEKILRLPFCAFNLSKCNSELTRVERIKLKPQFLIKFVIKRKLYGIVKAYTSILSFGLK